jgi:uncharacterized protein YdhG (YjbR/CyaY superfamily)
MRTEQSSNSSVDAYILLFPEPVQMKLNELRTLIIQTVPEVQEKISYQMPCYFLKGSLIYFAGYARHIGLYPGPSAIERFKTELTNYKTSKGTIQFPINEPLPFDLIKRIVELKVEENLKKKLT